MMLDQKSTVADGHGEGRRRALELGRKRGRKGEGAVGGTGVWPSSRAERPRTPAKDPERNALLRLRTAQESWEEADNETFAKHGRTKGENSPLPLPSERCASSSRGVAGVAMAQGQGGEYLRALEGDRVREAAHVTKISRCTRGREKETRVMSAGTQRIP
jgi:hypothetical protein